MNPCKRLTLGTVQFGLKYGIVNQSGKVSDFDLADILATAEDRGIDTLDTAIAYGDCETRLGELGVSAFRIGTKIPIIPDGMQPNECCRWVVSQVEKSLKRLRISRLSSVLVHRSDDLQGTHSEYVLDGLQRCKARGLCDSVGVSLYDVNAVESIARKHSIDLIQTPFNIFDQSIIRLGYLDFCNKMQIDVHVRSIFLQGLLVAEPNQRPEYFRQWESHWDRWDSWLLKNGCKAIDACVQFAISNHKIDRVVFGVENRSQLTEICDATEKSIAGCYGLCEFAIDDSKLINPSLWPKN